MVYFPYFMFCYSQSTTVTKTCQSLTIQHKLEPVQSAHIHCSDTKQRLLWHGTAPGSSL